MRQLKQYAYTTREYNKNGLPDRTYSFRTDALLLHSPAMCCRKHSSFISGTCGHAAVAMTLNAGLFHATAWHSNVCPVLQVQGIHPHSYK